MPLACSVAGSIIILTAPRLIKARIKGNEIFFSRVRSIPLDLIKHSGGIGYLAPGDSRNCEWQKAPPKAEMVWDQLLAMCVSPVCVEESVLFWHSSSSTSASKRSVSHSLTSDRTECEECMKSKVSFWVGVRTNLLATWFSYQWRGPG